LQYILRNSREQGLDPAMERKGIELDGLIVTIQAEKDVACSVAAKAGYSMITVRFGSTTEDLIRHRHRPTTLNLDTDIYAYVGTPPKRVSKSRTESLKVTHGWSSEEVALSYDKGTKSSWSCT